MDKPGRKPTHSSTVPVPSGRVRGESPNTGSGLFISLIGILCFFAGWYHYSASAVAIGTVLVLTPIVSYCLLRHTLTRIKVRREAPDGAFEGDTIEITISLENGSKFPLFQPRVEDRFRPELHSTKRIVFSERFRAGETLEKHYEGTCILPRGIHRLGPLRVTLSDPFGWFQLSREIDDCPKIKVFPAVQSISSDHDLGRSISKLLSELNNQGPGPSDEFFALRDYVHGDPMRRVHWAVSAHRGVPVVREFEKPSNAELRIFIDRSRESLIGIGRGSSLEHSVKIAAALASHALSRSQQVGVIAGSEARFQVSPGKGIGYLRCVLELMVLLRPNEEHPLRDILKQHARTLRKGSVILVMLSPCVYDDRVLVNQLRSWQAQGMKIIAVVFDAASFRQLENIEPQESSQRFVELLRSYSIKTYLLSCSPDLQAVFAQ